MGFEEVLVLIRQAKEGSESAKEALITHNSPLIKSVIRRYKNKGVEYDDLYQLGCIGFLKAIKNFSEEFGVKFSTYAVPMIAGEVKRFLRDDGYIKVSRSTKTLSIKIAQFVETYKKINGSSPKIEVIATEFGIEPQEIVFALDASKMPISIYERSGDDDNSLGIIDRLVGKDGIGDIDKMVLRDFIDKLDEREKKIILLRYYRDKTQAEIAKVMNVSQVQISRIETKIIAKLRQAMNEDEIV